MKFVTTKREQRLQNKQKKLLALSDIIKLNDTDRQKINKRSISESSTDSQDSDVLDIKKNEPQCANDSSTEMKKQRKKIKLNNSKQEGNAPTITSESDIDIKNVTCGGGDEVDNEISENMKKRIQLTTDEYAQLKHEINERKRLLRRRPRLRLRDIGLKATLLVKDEDRTPIFLEDIQNLLMLAILKNASPCTPNRWCQFEHVNKLSNTVVLIVEGLSLFHFLSHESQFVQTNKIFEEKLEVVMPLNSEGKIAEELAFVPLTSKQKEQLIQDYGSLEAAVGATHDPTLIMKTIFPVDNEDKESNEDLPSGDMFSRTKLLLSALQMVEESYPLPLRGDLAARYKDYAMTKDKYEEVTSKSPMFGLDCEMCRTNVGANELTRISIVDENMDNIYESLVRPNNKIVDYLTKYSGITPEMMLTATKQLKEVQQDVQNILPPDAILVGQSLNVDLHAMKMMHPYVIDTSIIFNLTGDRKRKTKLQKLAKEFLNEEIQIDKDGHDSIEDSQTALKLTKLKLSKGLDFGDAVLINRKKSKNNVYKNNKNIPITNNFFGHLSKNECRTAIVSSNETDFDFQKFISDKTKEKTTNTETIEENLDSETNISEKIDCFKANSNRGTIRKVQEIALDYSLVLTNLKILPEKLELSCVEKTISNVDKWINRLWDCVHHNGLLIVLLGGAPGTSSGVALLKIKKDISDVIAEAPITV